MDEIQILEKPGHCRQVHGIEQQRQTHLPFFLGVAHGDGNPVPEQQRNKNIIGGEHAEVQQQVHPPGHLVQQVHRAGGDAVEEQRQIGGGEAGDEAVVGVSSLRSMIQDAVSSATLSVSGDQPLINIEEMSVRSDDDIRKISQQLNTLLTAGRRAKGLV